jgi:GNAT superfamily N-acetyltransferase
MPPSGAPTPGRISRHRAEIARFGLAGWLRRNLFWVLAQRFGLDVVRVALLPLHPASLRPPAPLALEHRLVGNAALLAAAGGTRLDDEVAAARLARGDLCLATFHAGRLIATNWYSTGSTEIAADCIVRFPAAYVVSHDTFVDPAFRGQGVAFESWRVSREIFLARGATHILSCVRSGNVSSIRAMDKDEHTAWVGHVVAWRGLGRRAVFTSPGCRRLGIRAAMIRA